MMQGKHFGIFAQGGYTRLSELDHTEWPEGFDTIRNHVDNTGISLESSNLALNLSNHTKSLYRRIIILIPSKTL